MFNNLQNFLISRVFVSEESLYENIHLFLGVEQKTQKEKSQYAENL